MKKTAKNTSKSAKKSLVVFDTGRDAMAALLIVSLLINLFFVCLWVALRSTTQYDEALTAFFLGR
ncbi:MAG TPA: hypothetical protein VGE34_00640 [Candidatus Saccharimonadales bacterium]